MHRIALVLLLLMMSVCSFAVVMAQTSTVRGEASLMDQPGSQGPAVVLDMLSTGMRVEILSVQGNWARVRVPATSEVGWVQTSALASADAAAQDLPAGIGMRDRELDRVEGRVEMMSGGLREIEQRVDNLLEHLGVGAKARQEQEQAPSPMERLQPQLYSPFAMAGPGQLRWQNRFVMGTYLRGGQNYYGLALSRALDERGRSLLVGRVQYGLGEIRGNVDDFVDWTVGMDFNLFPETYVIYPYFGAHFGMRHLLEDTLADRHFFIAAPSLGVRAELGSIFTLGVELSGLFRFESGHRSDDGMVGFNCGYSW